MISKEKILVGTLKGNQEGRIPFWFMRQAGRYLPEYKAVRSKHKNFLEFCYTPKAAVEVTLQPITRFGMDGAIIFSDILVVPHALGADVRFEEGRGPVLKPIRDEKELAVLSEDKLTSFLAPVYEALEMTKAALPKETSLIGFAGAPWTIACYMVEGSSSKDFATIKQIAKSQPEFFAKLIALLTSAITTHIKNQIRAGAEIIQIFDSWAGIADDEVFRKWIVAPTKEIVASVKKEFPHIPVIGFPRQTGERAFAYVKETKVDGVSFDNSVTLNWVQMQLQPHAVVQGCLDNQLLAEDKAGMLAQAENIVETLKHKPFVFNLGHGILPHTPIENVQALCDYLKTVKRP